MSSSEFHARFGPLPLHSFRSVASTISYNFLFAQAVFTKERHQFHRCSNLVSLSLEKRRKKWENIAGLLKSSLFLTFLRA